MHHPNEQLQEVEEAAENEALEHGDETDLKHFDEPLAASEDSDPPCAHPEAFEHLSEVAQFAEAEEQAEEELAAVPEAAQSEASS